MNQARLVEADGWISELRMALVEGPCSRQLRAINELFRIVREDHNETPTCSGVVKESRDGRDTRDTRDSRDGNDGAAHGQALMDF
jgi:hypothetical protein